MLHEQLLLCDSLCSSLTLRSSQNLAVNTTNNVYLDGLGAPPEKASASSGSADPDSIYLWMSDYHPDGAQLFFPREPIPFIVCLGPASTGDDVTPQDMRAFYVPAGKGVYFHPGTWHNGVYTAKEVRVLCEERKTRVGARSERVRVLCEELSGWGAANITAARASTVLTSLSLRSSRSTRRRRSIPAKAGSTRG